MHAGTVLSEGFLDISVQSQLKQFCMDLVDWILNIYCYCTK